jgi:hypothetical protein
MVNAHSRLENKVTPDASDWELPIALRYGLTSSRSAAARKRRPRQRAVSPQLWFRECLL